MTAPADDGGAPPPPPGDDGPVATAADAAKMAAGLGVVFAIVAFAGFGGRTGTSVAVGAALAVGNLVALRALIRAFVPGDPNGPAAPEADPAAAGEERPQGSLSMGWALFAVAKILFLFGGVFLLLTRGVVDPMPLTVGYGVLPLGITASALFPPGRARS